MVVTEGVLATPMMVCCTRVMSAKAEVVNRRVRSSDVFMTRRE
jgi:hypothetical protein